MYKNKYNDLDVVYDKDIYEKLRKNDVDDLLARHMAHLFIRDPLVIFEELLDQDDENSMDHFEVNKKQEKGREGGKISGRTIEREKKTIMEDKIDVYHILF